jgi:hypothetical protein
MIISLRLSAFEILEDFIPTRRQDGGKIVEVQEPAIAGMNRLC